MQQTPYAPPAAPVSDPAEPVRPKPRSVVFAARCLWLSAGLAVVATVVELPGTLQLVRIGAAPVGGVVVGLVSVVVTAGLFALVAVKMNAGRGWVRWLYLAFYVFGLAMIAVSAVLARQAFLSLPPLTLALATFQTALQAVALVLMFVRPSREWFALPKQP